MVKLRHRLRWALTVEQWAVLKAAAIGASLVMGACICLAVLAFWAASWGSLDSTGDYMFWAGMGGFLCIATGLVWLFLIAFLYAVLVPTKRESPPQMGRGKML